MPTGYRSVINRAAADDALGGSANRNRLSNACLGAGPTDTVGYGAAFGLLLVPCVLAMLLATRARNT
ncbi:hypothetical protein [Streptomyces sp. NPDC002785]|uniref:hypothetical protein n=1 Tax=Streptomyces sp. NPDC002785 TaxID=3154543 RepID=UPI00331755FF